MQIIKKYSMALLVLLSFALALSGCSSSSSNSPAPSATYSISGAVSGAVQQGVRIDLTGAATANTTTDASGHYSFSGLSNGNYTVTPSLSGFIFNPASSAVTMSNADVTGKNFTATASSASTYSISGTVSGAVQQNVTITLSGSNSGSTLTDASGNYSFAGLVNGSYTVTPSLAGYTFNPTSTAVTVSNANATGKNFTATAGTAPTYSLSGTVSGPYVEGVTITMSGDGSGTTTSDASGNYSFANLPAGTYTLTPALAGYTYSPSAPAVVVSANTTQNFTASSAVASYSISGTVSKSTSKTGSIYLRAYGTNCNGCGSQGGTNIATTGGAYTIRGLQSGSYVVNAEMDSLGTGVKNATNPAGNSATATITSANVSGINIAVADRTPPAPVTPTGLKIYPSTGAAFIFWDDPQDSNGEEIASTYKIYWGTDVAATSGTPMTVNARNDGNRIQSGLADGTSYYYKISALVGVTESAASAVIGPVTIGATTGANTVSGIVTFPGTATGPMLVGLYSNTGVYFTTIASPVSPQSYSIAGIPSGSYFAFAIIDMNGNGVIDLGDISNTNNNGSGQITVTGNITGNNIILSSASATASVGTDHQLNGASHTYNLQIELDNGTKRAVTVTLVSGKNVAVPFDMSGDHNNFHQGAYLGATSPTVGDTYVFKAAFSDGTTETLSGSVTAVLNAFAQNLAAVTDGTGGSSTTVPLFTWAAPASPPATYTYNLNLWGSDANWYYPQDNGLPSTTTSALYNADGRASKSSLTPGTTYTWSVQVKDADQRNSASSQTTYTP
jgi:uncharacterized protein (DUF2141 family)